MSSQTIRFNTGANYRSGATPRPVLETKTPMAPVSDQEAVPGLGGNYSVPSTSTGVCAGAWSKGTSSIKSAASLKVPVYVPKVQEPIDPKEMTLEQYQKLEQQRRAALARWVL